MKRQRCEHCLNPKQTCICKYITTTSHRTSIVIIQCDKEGQHAKNTARLLPKLSDNITIIQESDEQLLKALKATSVDPLKTALLFPSVNAHRLKQVEAEGSDDTKAQFEQLIVIDGTWRKAKKLILTQQWLTNFPHVTLSHDYKSQYAIRKTTVDNGLSTLEAIAYAIAEIENRPISSLAPFFKLLEGINTTFTARMPENVKQRYAK